MRPGRPRPTAPDPATRRISASESRARASRSVNPRAVASFEPGSRMRAATIASTRSRCGDCAGSMSRSRRSVRSVPSTAATWPWGRERTMSKASSRPTSGSSLSSRRRESIFPLGHLERLARVRFLTLPFSRQPSRRRMAGGEFRMGTVSMYMATMCSRFTHVNPYEQSLLHGNILLPLKRQSSPAGASGPAGPGL